MATTNQERQAAFRAKKAEKFEEISLELAKTVAENREMREKIEGLEKKLVDLAASQAKKVANLEKRLLKALESKEMA